MTAANQLNKQIVVVSVDGLCAAHLGPYGNTWTHTNSLDELASHSILFENFIVDSLDGKENLTSFLTGTHLLERSDDGRSDDGRPFSVAEMFRESGIASTFLTDAEGLADSELIEDFDEQLIVEADDLAVEDGAEVPAKQHAQDIEETELAKFFSVAADQVRNQEPNSLLWIHSKGLLGKWDGPLALRQQFADEEDPDPPEIFDVPAMEVDDQTDPDDLTGATFCYAGQVVLLDFCIGALMEALQERGENCLLVFTSTSGFSLGEHGWIGAPRKLNGETIQVPLLVSYPQQQSHFRIHDFTQPRHLKGILESWIQPEEEVETASVSSNPKSSDPASDSQSPCPANQPSLLSYHAPFEKRNIAICKTDSEMLVRTPVWSYSKDESGDSSVHASAQTLYAKPDDYWEANELSSRCESECEEFSSRFDLSKLIRDHDGLPCWLDLPDELTKRVN